MFLCLVGTQLPLPPQVNEQSVCNAVDVGKDVDGFTTRNLGSLVQGVGMGRSFVPCTPLAVLKILETSVDIPFKGLNAVVAGRSHNVGLPIAVILAADAIKEKKQHHPILNFRSKMAKQVNENLSLQMNFCFSISNSKTTARSPLHSTSIPFKS